MRKIFIILFSFFTFSLIFTSVLIYWGYNYYNRDLPNFESISDYRPAVVSNIYDKDGTIIAEVFDEHRYFAKLNEIPVLMQKAFLASEDADFYNHPGIDVISIIRAMIKNLKAGQHKQGASTITQQVVKNLLLTKEKSLERKIKEAILSYRLEKRFTKDEIFELYLNQIFLGNKAYGVKAAAKLYFKKELKDLKLSEISILAGMPQAPSKFSPFSNLKQAKNRQKYVLNQMSKIGVISSKTASEAFKDELTFYKASGQGILKAPYYVDEVKFQFSKMFKDYNLNQDGLNIYTTLDLDAYYKAEKALQKGLKEVDKRRGWQGRIGSFLSVEDYLNKYNFKNLVEDTIYPAFVKNISGNNLEIFVGNNEATVSLLDVKWANKQVNRKDEYFFKPINSLIKKGDLIEVSMDENGKFKLDQTPEIEGAISLVDPFTGEVPVVVGGFDYQKSQFNRATQSLRQPGSAFKPIVYLTAVDAFGYTPTSIVMDQPRTFTIGTQVWSPANYDKDYLGGITLRTALEKSRNLVSVDIISKIGIEPVIKYAKKLGLTTPLGRNLSLSLGSSEVIPFELTRAYGVFPSGGVLHPSIFIKKVEDRFGKTIYDSSEDPNLLPNQVISSDVAFVMANMMKGVVESGTAQKIKQLKRVAAGKTGTSNNQMDTWFIGYTPKLVCGVWVGFDLKRPIGKGETGGAVSAPIWLYFMDSLLSRNEELEFKNKELEIIKEANDFEIKSRKIDKTIDSDFVPTNGVKRAFVNRQGQIVDEKTPGAIKEYFIKGKEPKTKKVITDYWQSNDL